MHVCSEMCESKQTHLAIVSRVLLYFDFVQKEIEQRFFNHRHVYLNIFSFWVILDVYSEAKDHR